MKWSEQNFDAVRQARAILEENGYCVSNLKHISFVQKINPKLSDEDAHEVLWQTFDNEELQEQINDQIEEVVKCF